MNRSIRTVLTTLGLLGAAVTPEAGAGPASSDVPSATPNPYLDPDSPESMAAKATALAKRARKNAARLELVRRGHLISVAEERERLG